MFFKVLVIPQKSFRFPLRILHEFLRKIPYIFSLSSCKVLQNLSQELLWKFSLHFLQEFLRSFLCNLSGVPVRFFLSASRNFYRLSPAIPLDFIQQFLFSTKFYQISSSNYPGVLQKTSLKFFLKRIRNFSKNCSRVTPGIYLKFH